VLAPDRLSFHSGMTRTTSATSRTSRLHAGPLFMAAARESPSVARAFLTAFRIAGLPSRVLLKHTRGLRLPDTAPPAPVVPDKSFPDGVGRYSKRSVGIVALFDTQVARASSSANLYVATNMPSSSRR